jgi:hypothetical protein
MRQGRARRKSPNANVTALEVAREEGAMKRPKTCYHCGAPATTREHAPPKSFFPPKANLQLKTVPSCEKHNNAKSNDDQYLLAHICMNTGIGKNLPKQIFLKSIAPQLEHSERFRQMLGAGSAPDPDGGVRYPVNVKRFDAFFDSLTRALYSDRYGKPFDDSTHHMSHVYLSLLTNDPLERKRREILTGALKYFFDQSEWMITHYEAAKLSEVVYQNKIIDPTKNAQMSVTIAHTFYGLFNVVTLLSMKDFFRGKGSLFEGTLDG